MMAKSQGNETTAVGTKGRNMYTKISPLTLQFATIFLESYVPVFMTFFPLSRTGLETMKTAAQKIACIIET
jgi:hypothetical protein